MVGGEVIMGFWRVIGNLCAAVMIVGGILLFPFGIVSIILGIFLAWMMHKNAADERQEKLMRSMVAQERLYSARLRNIEEDLRKKEQESNDNDNAYEEGK
jgi:UPF0716 family protein affecting phage T7 exclusion